MKFESKCLSCLFTMTDENSETAGTYYTVETTSKPRKDVKLTRNNMRTPQFIVEYNGKEMTLTIPIMRTDKDWMYELGFFIDMEIKPPKKVYLHGRDVSVFADGSISQKSLKEIHKDVKEIYAGYLPNKKFKK